MSDSSAHACPDSWWQTSRIRDFAKSIAVFLGLAIMALPAATCWLERRLGWGNRVFWSWGEFCALLPGLPGMYLRRSFYCLTLRGCARDCHIGLLSLIASRDTIIGSGVYIGPMTVIGFAELGCGALIGTRVGIMNGGSQHERLADGTLTPCTPDLPCTHIGAHTWIGEGALVLADVGARCTVGAGSVVYRAIGDDSVVAGNPARFIRKTVLGGDTNMGTLRSG